MHEHWSTGQVLLASAMALRYGTVNAQLYWMTQVLNLFDQRNQ
jgi:hypothetical protein